MARNKPTIKDYTVNDSYSADNTELRMSYYQYYRNKYYAIWQNLFVWDGVTPVERDYIMRRFWDLGTIAAYEIPNTKNPDGTGGLIGFMPYAVQYWNMYYFPERIRLINERGVSPLLVPTTEFVIGENAAIGWASKDHKPVSFMVENTVRKMVNLEMSYNANLQHLKLPWFAAVTPDTKDKIDDMLTKIINDEVAITAGVDDLQAIKNGVVETKVDFLLDKYTAEKVKTENELYTYWGLDNAGANVKSEQMLTDEVDSNNAVINFASDSLTGCINDWLSEISRLFGHKISIMPRCAPAEASKEETVKSEAEGGNTEMNPEAKSVSEKQKEKE